MPEHDPHFTLPECPVCSARQKCVCNWEHMGFYCFNCGATGKFEIHITRGLPESADISSTG